jgi:hypothetical protein
MAKVTRTSAGANFVSKEKFGTRNQVTATAQFELNVKSAGRKARAEMKKRLAEAKAIMPEPVSAGFVNVQFAYSV